MSLSAKRESLTRIHGRYQRAGRLHKRRILRAVSAQMESMLDRAERSR